MHIPSPIEKYCLGSMYVDYIETLRADPGKVCEFSRLALENMRHDLRILYDEIHDNLKDTIIPKELVA